MEHISGIQCTKFVLRSSHLPLFGKMAISLLCYTVRTPLSVQHQYIETIQTTLTSSQATDMDFGKMTIYNFIHFFTFTHIHNVKNLAREHLEASMAVNGGQSIYLARLADAP